MPKEVFDKIIYEKAKDGHYKTPHRMESESKRKARYRANNKKKIAEYERKYKNRRKYLKYIREEKQHGVRTKGASKLCS